VNGRLLLTESEAILSPVSEKTTSRDLAVPVEIARNSLDYVGASEETRKGSQMIIGDRLRAIREEKQLSQGDIENRTGLLRCYISRVENGHTVPAVETLEKFARALEVPIYQLFYDGEKPPELSKLPKGKTGEYGWGSSGKNARFLTQFRRLLGRVKPNDRDLLLLMANKIAGSAGASRRKGKQPA